MDSGPRILIAAGGYGGMHTALRLDDPPRLPPAEAVDDEPAAARGLRLDASTAVPARGRLT